MNWQEELLIEEVDAKDGLIGFITLTRVHALNALSAGMVFQLISQLDAWAGNPDCAAVVIQSASPKAFCAGGDIRQLHQHGPEQSEHIADFFRYEYALNYRIYTFPKPFIALLDGLTMGGGVGISLHGSFPLATENCRIAMPETTIGFFPDIGGSYVLAKASPEVSLYLALTGITIGPADADYAELIPHHIASADIPNFLKALKASRLAEDPFKSVKQLVSQFKRKDLGPASLSTLTPLIKSCFAADSVEGIIANLVASTEPWCQETVALLQQKSPTSLKVVFEQMRRVHQLSFRQTLEQDFRLVTRFLEGHDFFEGIRALLIDKDKQPRWLPAQLSEVSDKTVQSYFAPLPNAELELPQ